MNLNKLTIKRFKPPQANHNRFKRQQANHSKENIILWRMSLNTEDVEFLKIYIFVGSLLNLEFLLSFKILFEAFIYVVKDRNVTRGILEMRLGF